MARANANGTGGHALGSSLSRGAKIKRGLTAAILTVAFCTLALEVFLRVTDYREKSFEQGINRTNRRWVEVVSAGIFEEVDDHVRRYAMRPGAHAVVDGWTFRVTSHRTRGEDFPAEKPPGEKRLLCLGDSFAFGLWCDEDETLVGHLARMANERERSAGSDVTWRGINLGVPGYHSGQQLAAFEAEGLGLDPDVVVLYFNTNDIIHEGHFLDEELGALRADHLPLPTGLRRLLWRVSHLYGAITKAYTKKYQRKPKPHLNSEVPWSHVRPENQEYTAASIRRIAELCEERDLPLFFVHQPLMTWAGDTRSDDWEVLPLVAWAEDLREELGLPGINLLGLLRNYADGEDRFPADQDPDFYVERYIADEAVQRYFEQVDQGLEPDAEMPDDPDFHLLGAGYGHIAELCYPRMAAAGLVP